MLVDFFVLQKIKEKIWIFARILKVWYHINNCVLKLEVSLMKLKKIVEQLEYTVLSGSEEIDIQEIKDNAQMVKPGDVFVCIKGAICDGHEFAKIAIQNGAVAIVAECEMAIEEPITILQVSNTRHALARMSAAYFEFPAERLKMIGITGTKGKTSTAYFTKAMLEEAGHQVGLIGTVEIETGKRTLPAKNTTPESIEIHRYLREMVDAGCTFAVMEVSSQALKLFRTEGIEFAVGIFTNLGEDHIGPHEHEDLGEYLACKKKLFSQCKIGIGNIDDCHFQDMFQDASCKVESFGCDEHADWRASEIHSVKSGKGIGIGYRVSGNASIEIEVGIPGKYSVYNSLAAMATCWHFGVTKSEIYRACRNICIKGRNEMVPVSGEYMLMIDYAHNAMSLEHLLSTLREYRPSRLVCLFGCGGNRSKLRRYEMGEVSGRLADLTILTSDNPRDEEPQEIINDIKIGIAKTSGEYIEIVQREEAIRYVIKNAKPGDLIVLAGKGHEDYQEIKGKKYTMDEREIVRRILEEKND